MSAFTPKYAWKQGLRMSTSIDVQAVGELCDKLTLTEEGLTSESLLNANRTPDAPLYNYFEWDNDIAAEKYRLEQSRFIIRSIVTVEEEKPVVRSFHSVVVDSQPVFESITTIVKSVDLTSQMLEQAKKDLFAFQLKYSALKDYVELADVFASIENLRK